MAVRERQEKSLQSSLLHRRVGETLLRGHTTLMRGREETICLYAWERRVRVQVRWAQNVGVTPYNFDTN